MTDYEWVPFSGILAVLNKARWKCWSWSKNTRCKYIIVRIDMRNQKCILRDQDGKPLTLKELEYQYESKATGST